MALRKDGALVHLIERKDIEARLPENMAHNLVHAFDRFADRSAATNDAPGLGRRSVGRRPGTGPR